MEQMNKTPLECLDPRSKMMMTLCISTLAIAFSRPVVLFGILLFCLLILLAGKAPVKLFLQKIRALLYLILFLFIIQCVFVREGEPLLQIDSLIIITRLGMEIALSVVLRLLILVFSGMILASGQVRDYLLALVQCRVPYELAFMVMMVIRFIPLLRQDAQDVFYAAQMRGTELEKVPFQKKLSILLRLLLPIAAGALERVRIMSIAMETRMFRAYSGRTYHRILTLSNFDKTILLLFPVCTLAAGLLLG